MKKIFFTIIAFLMVISTSSTIYAEEINEDANDKLTALKETIKMENVGEYDVNIKVPGYENEKVSGYNFIIVIDGSYSTDNNWTKMRSSVIRLVNNLLPEEDASMNFNKVALISFGVDYHINIPLTNDVNTFEEVLPKTKGNSLLSPGRSSTNMEVGFKGAREYIESIKDTELYKDKEHTYVIYLSDGGVNTTEAPFNYYKILTESNRYYAAARESLAIVLNVLDNDIEGVTYDEIFDKFMEDLRIIYSGNPDDSTSVNDIINHYGFSSETITNFLNEKLKEFYVYSGYDLDKEYSAGEFERMFVNKQYITGFDQLREMLLDVAYAAFMANKNVGTNGVARTIAEGNRLKESATIYTIGYNANSDTAKKILDPTYGDNTYENHYSSGYSSANIDTISDKLTSLIEDIIKINYKNPIITDYTSKWVTPMDINGDGIFDENDIIVTNNGIEVNANIKVKKLTTEEINLLNDPELINNTSNDVYRITWQITDYLRSWDNYKLTYRVKVDTMENGFVSEKEYPANGNIDLTYSLVEIDDNNNETIISEKENGTIIREDQVSQKENIVVITKKDEEGNLLEGADFDIVSEEGTNQVIKEYSTDGVNYTKDNSLSNATYFRFSGLYDFRYTISEIKVPTNYIKINDMLFDFYNQEGINKEVSVVNEKKTGKVIIHYVVKVNDEYIPFNEFAYDDNGNLLPNFEGINIEDIVLSGKINDGFSTLYDEIDGLTLEGLYDGDTKLTDNIYTDKFTEDTKEYTYVYNLNIGYGEEDIPMPPQTGYEISFNYLYLIIFNIICLLVTLKKIKL